MVEPWKTTLCDSEQCIDEMFVPENLQASSPDSMVLTNEAIQKYKIYPEIDNDVMTQFKCPRCGKVQTWGVTRKHIAQTLYQRYFS